MPKNNSRTIRAILFFAVLAGILLFIVLTAGQAAKNIVASPSERYRQEGDTFAAEHRISEAVLAYRQAVEVDPKNRKAIQSLADAYQNQGRLRMAARYRSELGKAQATPDALHPAAFQETKSQTIQPLWATLYSPSVPISGAIANGLFVAAYGDGTLAAIHVSDGSTVWKIKLPTLVTSAPTIGQDSLWVGGYDGALYMLSLLDGRQIWKHETDGPIYAPPAVTSTLILCPSGDGNLYALNKQDGSERWHFRTAGPLHGAPAVSENEVFIGSGDGKLYAISLSTGAPLWQDGIQAGAPIESRPAAVNGRVIFGSGDGRVYALAPQTGGQYWRFSTADAVFAQPVVAGDTVYITSSGGTLSAVNFLNGKKIWQVAFKSILRNPPALTSDRVYLIADADPNLYTLDRGTGAILETLPTGDWIEAGPWIEDERLILLGKDGTVLGYTLNR